MSDQQPDNLSKYCLPMLSLGHPAQQAHAADAASRRQDRGDFGSNISYNAFLFY